MEQGNKQKAKWAEILDWIYYILILGSVVVFSLTKNNYQLKWAFLIPVVLAVIARIASYIIKQKKG